MFRFAFSYVFFFKPSRILWHCVKDSRRKRDRNWVGKQKVGARWRRCAVERVSHHNLLFDMFAIILLRTNTDYFWAISLDKHHALAHTNTHLTPEHSERKKHFQEFSILKTRIIYEMRIKCIKQRISLRVNHWYLPCCQIKWQKFVVVLCCIQDLLLIVLAGVYALK